MTVETTPELCGPYWTHPQIPHTEYPSESYVKQECHRLGLDPSQIECVDKRWTLQQVVDWLSEQPFAEAWDEYLSVDCEFRYEKEKRPEGVHTKWPERYRWVAAYVVTGGSEGLYLHVDVIDNDGNRQMVILGKSLGHSWDECWASAAEIAKALEA